MFSAFVFCRFRVRYACARVVLSLIITEHIAKVNKKVRFYADFFVSFLRKSIKKEKADALWCVG